MENVMKNGKFELYYENGQLKEKYFYKQYLLDGPYIAYHENGQLREKCSYINGFIHGPYISYYKNGQLSFKNGYKVIPELEKPDSTYDNFYFIIFDHKWEPDLLFKLNDQFKRQKKFLSKLGFKELLNDDGLIFDISSDGNHINCKSYFDNGRLKFEYTHNKHENYKIDKSTETFELFYRDCQPKFRFRYEKDEENMATGDYQVFYNNGQLKERGDLSYNDSSFDRFSKKGQLIESFSDNEFYKYHDNEKLHYRITLDSDRKNGPYEIYDRAGLLTEKGSFEYDEMLDGPFEGYFEDGKLYQRCFYKNGLLEGVFEEYHPNGQIYRRCSYKNGLREGIFKEYYIFGELNIKWNYVKGKIQDDKYKNQFIGFD